jgi:predicted Zn-dependent protease
VVVLHRNPLAKDALETWTRFEDAEANTVVHEVGHWLGVPARDNHTSATSTQGKHCNHGGCVMFGGTSPCSVLASLTAREPTGFCVDCAAELAEMARLRDLSPHPAPGTEPSPTDGETPEVTEVRVQRGR